MTTSVHEKIDIFFHFSFTKELIFFILQQKINRAPKILKESASDGVSYRQCFTSSSKKNCAHSSSVSTASHTMRCVLLLCFYNTMAFAPSHRTMPPSHHHNAAAAMMFFSFGDWGPPHPSATGWRLPISDGIVAAAQTLGEPRFIMTCGDNFYESGIEGDEYSSRFRTFEEGFPQPQLRNIPFFAIAGNHDHMGNLSAQIAYSDHSSRWRFPSMWYTFSEIALFNDGRNATTQIVYIDTLALVGDPILCTNPQQWQAFIKIQCDMQRLYRAQQQEWLETTLNASKADYLWIAGHHGMFGHCENGPYRDVINYVLPLMRAYNVTGYIGAHDHCNSHYNYRDPISNQTMTIIVGGAGGGSNRMHSPDHLYHPLNPGLPIFRLDASIVSATEAAFVSYAVGPNGTVVRHHLANGTVLFTAAPIHPRSGPTVRTDITGWSLTDLYQIAALVLALFSLVTLVWICRRCARSRLPPRQGRGAQSNTSAAAGGDE